MKYFCLLFVFVFTSPHAEEVMVNSLGQGSCWYQNKDSFRLSSFNDSQSINLSFEELTTSLLRLVPGENKELQTLNLHCGALGASLIARIKSDGSNLCLWAMLDKGKLKVRSLGGTLEANKGDSKLCDGFKQGEVLVALKNHDYVDQIRSEKWSSVIKEIIPVAFDIYKIKLTKEYFLREEEVAKMFQENFFVSVEFNQYQHGIGEYVQLK